MNLFSFNRIDSILVWGHGLKYLSKILADIRQNKHFEVLKIQRHKPQNIKGFVKEVYSYDYAPFWHLKEKTRYLIRTPREVCFIFIKNKLPDEDFLGEGDFRHRESLTLKKFKEELRDRYNPYENGKRSHHHVIHATDSQEQTNKILQYLGYPEAKEYFSSERSFIDLPYYLKGYKNFEVKEVDVSNLSCNVVDGNSWDDYYLKMIPLKKSPHYRGFIEGMHIYEKYVDKYLGGPLQEDYNMDRFHRIYKNFEYLKDPYQNSFVIAEKVGSIYVVLDGVHRACIHAFQGNEKIKICQISK